MMQARRFSKLLSATIGCIAITAAASFAQTMGGPERYVASAIDINNGSAGNIDIKIDRWSTDAQRDKLMEVMQTKGPDKLLDALQGMPRMGYFGATGNLGWDIHFARKTPLPAPHRRPIRRRTQTRRIRPASSIPTRIRRAPKRARTPPI